MSRRPVNRWSATSSIVVMLAASLFVASTIEIASGAPSAADCDCKSPAQAPSKTPAAAPGQMPVADSRTDVRTIWKCRKVEISLSSGISQYGGNVCADGELIGAFGQMDVWKLPLLSATAICGKDPSFCYGPFRATATETPPEPSPTPVPVDRNSTVKYPPVFSVGAPIKPKYDEGKNLLELDIPNLFKSKIMRHEVVEYPVGAGASAKKIRVELFAIAYELVLDLKTSRIVKGTYLVGREIAPGREKLTAKVDVRAIAKHAHEVLLEGELSPYVVVNHSRSPGETNFVLPEDDRDDADCDCRRPRLRNLLRGCRR